MEVEGGIMQLTRIGTDEETRRAADGRAQTLVGYRILERGFLDVNERSAEYGPRSPQPEVECRAASDPRPGEDLEEG